MSIPGARQTVLLAQTTLTTTGNTGVLVNVPQGYSGAIISASAATVSGTTPTLVVYVQNAVTAAAATDVVPAIPTGVTLFQDLLALATLTTTNTNAFALFMQTSSTVVTGGQQQGTLTPGTANNGPLGAQWRIAWVLSGTNPSFATTVQAMFVPEG